jgi:hypothetical protein
MSAPHVSLLEARPPTSDQVAMATFDADLVCTHANPVFADLTGIDLDALLAAAAVTERAVGHELPSSLYRAGGRSVPRSAATR